MKSSIKLFFPILAVVSTISILSTNQTSKNVISGYFPRDAKTITKNNEIIIENYLKQDFELAKRQSDGFFDDVPSHIWKRLHQKVKDIYPRYNPAIPPVKDGHFRNVLSGFFYQNHYEPDFVCSHERRIGKMGDGGKWICDPHRIAQKDSCLVYSVGSNNDFSFEEAVLRDISPECEIHTFDPKDYSAGAKAAGVEFHQVWFTDKDVDKPNNAQTTGKGRTLSSIVKELGHEGRTIDVFKIDCEGCEWSSIAHWFEADITLKQIQVELHKSEIPGTMEFFDVIWDNHYVITHKEPNIAYPLGRNSLNKPEYAIEYAFLKMSPEFMEGIGEEEEKEADEEDKESESS